MAMTRYSSIQVYFKKLFTLPKARYLILYNLLISGAYILLCMLLGTCKASSQLLISLLVLFFVAISPYFIPLIWRDRRMYNITRLSLIALLSTSLFAITDIVSGGKMKVLSLSPSVYLQLLVVHLISGSSLIKNILLEAMNIVPSYVLCIHFNLMGFSLHDFFILLMTFSSPLIALFITLYYLHYYSDMVKLNLLELGRGFAHIWLGNDPFYLERELYKICDYAVIPIHYIKIYDDDMLRGVLLAPEFHYGPFRNVGSSNFPAVFLKKIKHDFNCEGIIFHGASTHKLNLVSLKDVDRVLSALHKVLAHKRSIRRMEGIANPIIIKGSSFRIIGFAIGRVAILLVSALDKGIEDIPNEYWRLAKNIGNRLGFADVILIDEHNGLVGHDIDVSELTQLIPMCLKRLAITPTEPIKISIATQQVPLDEVSGIGRGGVCALILEGEYSKSRLALVVIDGNNMIPKFRKNLTKFLKEKTGIENVEVLTTDTHAVSCIPGTDKGYIAVGEDPKHAILMEYTLKCLNKAMSSKFSSFFEHGIVKVKVKVYGNTLSKMYNAVTYGYKAFVKRALPLSLLLLICTILILGSLF